MSTPLPFHRWAVNEDPGAISAHPAITSRPDHCLTCGIVRYPLTASAQRIAAGPCPGHRIGGRLEDVAPVLDTVGALRDALADVPDDTAIGPYFVEYSPSDRRLDVHPAPVSEEISA